MSRVVVVGASMGGLRAAESVRRHGHAVEIVVVGEEPHMPYNRPPLSKEALRAEPDVSALAFRIPRHAKDVTWQLGHRVVAADLAACTVTLDDDEVLDWEGLVVAAGLAPRRVALEGPLAGRHVVRTIEDAQRLRHDLVPGARVVVVGAGFIGCEAAATARTLGAEVDVVAPESVPMRRPLGLELGAALQRRHEAYGVRFHLGRLPAEVTGTDRVTGVVLDDGTHLGAEVLIEAVGCTPNVEWLQGNDLDLADGMLCDNGMRVLDTDGRARPDVVACGDLARFPNLLFDDEPRRVEHWTMVTDTAKRAGQSLAAHLTGAQPASEPFTPVPSFWSDQYDIRLQSFGSPNLGPHDIRVLEGSLGGDVVMGYHRDGRLVGVVLVGLAGRFMHFRDRIASRLPTPAVLSVAP